MLGGSLGRSDYERSSGRQSSAKNSKKLTKRAFKAVMKSYKFKLPMYDFPLRLRPWFIGLAGLIMLILAFLGFTNFAHSLPLNDKILHLVCLCLATTVVYFVFDVEEDARRIWFWRHAPLILTAIICFLFGGIVSEIIQSLLPYKEFQVGDVAANLIGSSIGLWTAYYLERYYRRRQEISRLYRPISLDPDELSESDLDDDEASGTMLLPTHHDRSTLGQGQGKGKAAAFTRDEGRIRLNDVWDEREEIFGIGDESEDEDGTQKAAHGGPVPHGVSTPPPPPAGPRIVVTSS